jgi:hypothetical protein
MTDLKNKTIEVSISSVASLIPVLVIVWFVIQPIMLKDLSTAMAQDVEQKIEDKLEPVQGAFKILLLSNINKLKRSIASLEHSRSQNPEAWTDDRNRILVDNKIELVALQEAYSEL